jgi:V8-like Glu-specific endopeptidase
MRKKLTYGLLIAGSSLLAHPSLAAFIMSGKAATNDAPLINSTDPGAERFRSVGKLFASTDCTATLVSGEKTPAAHLPALIITAGHCVDSNMKTNQVIVDQPAAKEWKYIPDYFIDKHQDSQPVAVSRILYATMKQVDLAILQLDTTYGDLAQKGYLPLKLKKTALEQGQSIELTHIPVDGVDENRRYLRHSDCTILNQAPVLYEYNFPWIWKPAYSVDCKGISGGTSGSPVILKDQSDIIGILNTTVTPGYTGCGLGRPCEIINNKPVVSENVSYFIPVSHVAAAFTDEGKVDMSKLDNNSGNILERNGNWVTQSKVNDVPATWNIIVDNSVRNIKYKSGPANETSCTNTGGYSEAIPVENQPLKTLPVPENEGIYMLCVLGQTADNKWQTPANASLMLHEIDNTPPKLKPTIGVTEEENAWRVGPEFKPYEITGIQIKFGPLSSTDCDDKDGYTPYFRVPKLLSKKDAPWRFCAYGQDQAMNDGLVVKLDLGDFSIKIENYRVVAAWNYPLPKEEFLRRTGATSSEGDVFIDMPDDKYFELYKHPDNYEVPLKAGNSTAKVTLEVKKEHIRDLGSNGTVNAVKWSL